MAEPDDGGDETHQARGARVLIAMASVRVSSLLRKRRPRLAPTPQHSTRDPRGSACDGHGDNGRKLANEHLDAIKRAELEPHRFVIRGVGAESVHGSSGEHVTTTAILPSLERTSKSSGLLSLDRVVTDKGDHAVDPMRRHKEDALTEAAGRGDIKSLRSYVDDVGGGAAGSLCNLP